MLLARTLFATSLGRVPLNRPLDPKRNNRNLDIKRNGRPPGNKPGNLNKPLAIVGRVPYQEKVTSLVGGVHNTNDLVNLRNVLESLDPNNSLHIYDCVSCYDDVNLNIPIIVFENDNTFLITEPQAFKGDISYMNAPETESSNVFEYDGDIDDYNYNVPKKKVTKQHTGGSRTFTSGTIGFYEKPLKQENLLKEHTRKRLTELKKNIDATLDKLKRDINSLEAPVVSDYIPPSLANVTQKVTTFKLYSSLQELPVDIHERILCEVALHNWQQKLLVRNREPNIRDLISLSTHVVDDLHLPIVTEKFLTVLNVHIYNKCKSLLPAAIIQEIHGSLIEGLNEEQIDLIEVAELQIQADIKLALINIDKSNISTIDFFDNILNTAERTLKEQCPDRLKAINTYKTDVVTNIVEKANKFMNNNMNFLKQLECTMDEYNDIMNRRNSLFELLFYVSPIGDNIMRMEQVQLHSGTSDKPEDVVLDQRVRFNIIGDYVSDQQHNNLYFGLTFNPRKDVHVNYKNIKDGTFKQNIPFNRNVLMILHNCGVPTPNVTQIQIMLWLNKNESKKHLFVVSDDNYTAYATRNIDNPDGYCEPITVGNFKLTTEDKPLLLSKLLLIPIFITNTNIRKMILNKNGTSINDGLETKLLNDASVNSVIENIRSVFYSSSGE